ncbi:MAG TPA: antitoxin Xre/MbcA/ParS toxin-binding domain-containing protein [Blastocatellia bacterium]|nr:antitoxin Xre/MbcA/ParS toxin-binding domain-containing protein [Blastocatellia bacterium]
MKDNVNINSATGQMITAGWLGVKASNTLQLVKAIGSGFPFATLEHVRKETGLPMERLATSIGLSPRTLTRRKKEKKLSAYESDRLVTVTRLLTLAVELFEGNKTSALRWFVQPNRALGNFSPLEMAATETGAREVENLMGRLEHGVFS